MFNCNFNFPENRAGPSNLGNVISQILLCKTIAPDFNQEEIHSIAKDSQELNRIVHEMQEFLPQQETAAGIYNPVWIYIPMCQGVGMNCLTY